MYRPTVPVRNHKEPQTVVNNVRLPNVFKAPIRNDIVQFVHDNLSRNNRQAHGVDPRAGMKHSAESWGTGRAVARIPRISGSGTHRSGQGAFGNMCRKGRMAFGLKTWRRWHRKVNLKQRRHALASAIASTAVTSLVMARGHKVSKVPQFPLVVDDAFGNVSKTREALDVLNKLGAGEDLKRVNDKKKMRSGRSKARGKRFKKRLGPLIIVNDKSESLYRATRNVEGVSLLNVNRLNIRHLAPGGQLGRFVIFTQGAFTELEKQFGSYKGTALKKKGYQLKREVVNTPEISAIINSDVIQRVLRKKRSVRPLHPRQKKNPLRNKESMDVLNPYAPEIRKEKLAQRGKKIRKSRKDTQQYRERSAKLLEAVNKQLDVAEQEIDQQYRDELALTKV